MSDLREEAARLAAEGDLEGALRLTRALASERPDDALVWQRLGDLALKQARHQEAVSAWQRAAGQLALEGRLLRAIGLCQDILALEPQHTETQETLAALFSRTGLGEPVVLPESMTPPGGLQPIRPIVVDPARLARHPLFSALSREDFLALVGTLRSRRVGAGEVIVREGDTALAMFCLVEGEAEAVRGPPGAEVRLSLMSEGDFFGELALLASSARTATVRMTRPGLLFEVTTRQLAALGEQHPRVLEVVHRHYKQRLLQDLLRASPLFQSFASERTAELVDAFHAGAFRAGTVLVRQDEPATGLYVLLRGRCSVVQRVGGQAVPHPAMSEGSVFGEISLLSGEPTTAEVEAQTEVVVLWLPRHAFERLIARDPDTLRKLQGLAATRLQRTEALGGDARLDVLAI